MEQLTLVAMGGGTMETVSQEGAAALQNAAVIIGAPRLLQGLPEICPGQRIPATRTEDVLKTLMESGPENCCVVYSGDTGFYSGASQLLERLDARGIPVRVCPGISSVQLLASRLHRPWQDWNLVSAHGVACDAVTAVSQGKPTFFLTGGTCGPTELCRQLTMAGLGNLKGAVGEHLSAPQERVRTGTVRELAKMDFAELSVLWVEAAPQPEMRGPGLPDRLFIRGKVPMTKQEVRAVALAKLAIQPGDTVWDVGAGTGSVSVELALAARCGRAYAIERSAEACGLIRQNRERLCAWNLRVVEGHAPEALDELPAPDAVFIGGTKGELPGIVDGICRKNPAARICISAIALETLTSAVETLERHGIQPQVTQISVSRTSTAGQLHLLLANNPVFLIAGGCDD